MTDQETITQLRAENEALGKELAAAEAKSKRLKEQTNEIVEALERVGAMVETPIESIAGCRMIKNPALEHVEKALTKLKEIRRG